MKGVRYYALLGGLIFMAGSPMSALADDSSSTSKAGDKPKVNETESGNQRGVTFGQLFNMTEDKPNAGVPLQAPASTPMQVTHTLRVSTHHVSKTATAHASANKQTVKTASKAAEGPHVVTAELTAPTATKSEFIAVGNPTASTPVISVSLNKPGVTPKYRSGDKMVIGVTASTECNLLIFDYDSHGTLTQLFPNKYQPEGAVKAGQKVQIGGEGSDFDFEITGSGGLERIFVYAYPTQSAPPLTVAMNQDSRSPFRSAELTADQYMRMVKDAPSYYNQKTITAGTRGVKVVEKGSSTMKASSESNSQPNKIELSFQVDGK